MTKEEAKDFLCSIARDLRLIYGEDYTSKDGTKMRDAIEILEQEPRKGHWIDHSEEGYVECSECGNATYFGGNTNELHFCFSCRADMRGREE